MTHQGATERGACIVSFCPRFTERMGGPEREVTGPRSHSWEMAELGFKPESPSLIPHISPSRGSEPHWETDKANRVLSMASRG